MRLACLVCSGRRRGRVGAQPQLEQFEGAVGEFAYFGSQPGQVVAALDPGAHVVQQRPMRPDQRVRSGLARNTR